MENEELKQQLLTVKEVCKILQITRVTLWKWRKQKKLESIFLGKNIRYKKNDIQKILKDGIK